MTTITTGSGTVTPVAPSSADNSFTSTTALASLLKRNLWMRSKVSQEPVLGLVDGINTRFSLASPPAVAGSVSIIMSNGSTVTPSSIDEDGGSFLVAAAPTQSLYASYTHSLISNDHALGLFDEGFAMMQALWPRSYYVITDAITGLRTLSTSISAIVDPQIGDLYFAQRPAQVSLFTDCMFLVWANSALTEATYNAIAVREQRASGLQIDRTRQPDAFRSMIEMANKRIRESLAAARIDAGEEAPFEMGTVTGLKSTWNTETAWYNDVAWQSQ